MRLPKNVKLVKATYLKDYIYRFEYSNGKVFDTNFKPILLQGGFYLFYLDITRFRKMKIDPNFGDIYWGKDWDICFHIETIYGEEIIKPRSNRGYIAYLKETGLYQRYYPKKARKPQVKRVSLTKKKR